jgi:hypothetical protein
MKSIVTEPRFGRWAVFALSTAILSGCGNSGAPTAAAQAGANGAPGTALGACTTDVATDSALIDSIVPSVEQVRARQAEIDLFGGGFRIAGNQAEQDYIDQLASDLRALGATDILKEPYSFSAFSPGPTQLEVVQGPTPGPLPVAYFIPASGSTGPGGLTGPAVYLSALSDVNFVGAIYTALSEQNPTDALMAMRATLQNAVGGGVSLAQAIASANVAGKIVVYDAPKLTLTAGVFEAISVYYNNSSGTLGPTTPYTRPFVDELLTIGAIDKALATAGAAGAIAVIDYPAQSADNSYVPFGALAIASIPGLYVDRDTGAALKQQIVDSGATPLLLKMTLDAPLVQTTSYNLSATIPGACGTQILVSSHTDGPNSLEDNGPAAILSIADYFVHAPASQRRRGLKIVFTGGHFDGSPGLTAYIAQHQAELSANVLSVIEIEHLGAREWLELSPGTMGLDGLAEPLVLYAGAGSVQQDENVIFAKKFDRSIVTIPLPFGEGGAWASSAGLPKTQLISGPVYLLNGPFPAVSTEFTDYDLEQRQITALIQMVLDLNTQTASTLLADKNLSNLP